MSAAIFMSGNVVRRRSRSPVRSEVRVSGRRQQHPNERNARAVPCYRDHQNVDRGLTEIPVRPIDRQNPWLARKPQQIDNHTCCQRAVDVDELEEPVKPPPHRGNLRRARDIGRKSPKTYRSMLHDQQRQPR
jgi:hypothetical protein